MNSFRIINSTLIILIFISWLMIASLNWNAPDYVRTLWVIDRLLHGRVVPQLIIECKGYILTIVVPFFTLFVTSVVIFFIINIKRGKINYLEEILMKLTFYSIILSSIMFIVIFNIPLPPPQGFLILDVPFETNKVIIQFYFTWVSVIGVILIIISLIGLHLIGEFSKKREIEHLIVKR